MKVVSNVSAMSRQLLVVLTVLIVSANASSASRSHAHLVRNSTTMAEVAAKIGIVIERFQEEEKVNDGLINSEEQECETISKGLGKLSTQGARDAAEAEADLNAINAEVVALTAQNNESKEQLNTLGQDIDNLVKQLADLRMEQRQAQSNVMASFQQIEGAISQTRLRRQAAALHAFQLGSERKGEVGVLKELGRELLSEAQPTQPLNFLQFVHKSPRSRDSQKENAKRLQEDQAMLRRAAQAENDDFDKKEKELVDLIELRRKEFREVEANLRTQQPALAAKLKQASELERTLASARRSLDRDQTTLQLTTKKCQVLSNTSKSESMARSRSLASLKTAKVLIEKSDPTLFLSKDMQIVPSMRAMSFLQESSKYGSMIPTSAQVTLVQEVAHASATGSLEDVARMIQALISSLQDQANNDMDKNQFCVEGVEKNRKAMQDAQEALNLKAIEIRWAETAVARLGDEASFLETEAARLQKAFETASAEQISMEKRRKAESDSRRSASEVVLNCVNILATTCDLNNRQQSEKSQCGLAADALAEAHEQIKQFDTLAGANLAELSLTFQELRTSNEQAAKARSSDLLNVQRDKARRNKDLVDAQADLTSKQHDVATLVQELQELESTCSPKVSKEERQQRRLEEIDALKNALGVLSGETLG